MFDIELRARRGRLQDHRAGQAVLPGTLRLQAISQARDAVGCAAHRESRSRRHCPSAPSSSATDSGEAVVASPSGCTGRSGCYRSRTRRWRSRTPVTPKGTEYDAEANCDVPCCRWDCRDSTSPSVPARDSATPEVRSTARETGVPAPVFLANAEACVHHTPPRAGIPASHALHRGRVGRAFRCCRPHSLPRLATSMASPGTWTLAPGAGCVQ